MVLGAQCLDLLVGLLLQSLAAVCHALEVDAVELRLQLFFQLGDRFGALGFLVHGGTATTAVPG